MLLYRLGILLYGALIGLLSIGHAKARKWVLGRRGLFEKLSDWRATHPGKLLVVHAASLGEFEQARALIDWWKRHHADWKILVSFYSPSGYEHYSSSEADGHCYLPLDTASNARSFVDILQPSLFVFVRYDFWLELIQTLHKRQIPQAVISSFFRSDMWFLKPWARFALSRISGLDAILTQNEESVELLRQYGVRHAQCTGDGRIDRVAELARHPKEMAWLKQFKANRFLLIAGSPWPPDEDRLLPFLHQHPEAAVLMAPHDVSQGHVNRLIKRLEGLSVIRWSDVSDFDQIQWNQFQVVVLDTIGWLSSSYQFADAAFIGGGFTTGIHSIQEPAAYGCPVLFGPKHSGFPEAQTLMSRGGAKEIYTAQDLMKALEEWMESPSLRHQAGAVCKAFIEENRGASERMGRVLEQLIR